MTPALPLRLPLLALLFVAGAGACTASGSGPGVPHLAFVSSVDPVSQAGGDTKKITDEGNGIVRLFTDWYQLAFIDPKGWKDPEFTDVTRHFTEQARTQATKEIGSLTIGEGRTELRRVTPGPSRINVTVYADDQGISRYAVADVIFRAMGTLKAKGPPMEIVQTGTYFLSKDASGWKIWSYRSRVDEAQVPPSPGASP